MNTKSIKVLFIDNFDSFTYNLVDEFGKRNCPTKVYRADTALEELIKVYEDFQPDLLLLSPGPGTPSKAGVTIKALDYFKDKLPVFGVCLGHQAITEYFGGTVSHAKEVMHGKSSKIAHTGKGLFDGLENPMHVGRYHSLCSTELPDCLEMTADYDGIVMGIQHKTLPIHGVQFHPESILTPTGGQIIENMIKIAVENRG
jgi:anthranilate synthase/aminodeoxychorismate synthase-like glutamine amidotransferase